MARQEFLAQNLVGRANVEEQRLGPGRAVGGLQQGSRRQVGEDEARALGLEIGQGLGGVFARLQPVGDEPKFLSQKFAGDIIVVETGLGARLSVVLGGQVET